MSAATFYVAYQEGPTPAVESVAKSLGQFDNLVIIDPGFTGASRHGKVICLSADIPERDIAAIMGVIAIQMKHNQIQIVPNIPEKDLWIDQTLKPLMQESMSSSVGTHARFRHTYQENLLHNIRAIAASPGISELKGRYAVPFVVVGAGPSIDKNIEALRLAKSKAYVVAAGSGLQALMREGIMPDAWVLTDPQPQLENLPLMRKEITLFAPYEAPHACVNAHPGPRFFFSTHERFGMRWLARKPKTDSINQNRSVSTAAINLALFLGATHIIMAGQDLAYESDGKHHAAGHIGDDDPNPEKLFDVEGYHGGTVKTEKCWHDVAKYMLSLPRFHPGVKFINATEGGARIQNFDQIPLAEVLASLPETAVDAISAPPVCVDLRPDIEAMLGHLKNVLKVCKAAENVVLMSEEHAWMVFNDIISLPGWYAIVPAVLPELDRINLSTELKHPQLISAFREMRDITEKTMRFLKRAVFYA
jgi:D-ribose pyranose/furanose isomerase RbsD